MSIPLGDLTIDEDLLKQALSTAPLSERARLIALIEELKRRQNREFAQQNFLAFVQQVWPSFIYGRHHARMAQEFEKVVSGENKRLIINLGPRHAVQIDEPIPTPTGWKTMQTLQIGDDVFGQDGKPTKVIGKSEVFHNQQLYRVTTDDGHSLDVDGEHLWTVRIGASSVFETKTTEDLYLFICNLYLPDSLCYVNREITISKIDRFDSVQCIKVENEDGLFLAGKGYICTHNTKSEFGSYLLPAWYLGKNPDKKIIQCSHTAELAVGFGRKVRNLVGSSAYQEIFPGVELQQDSKAAGRWNTSAGGSYFAIGVSGAVTGIGGDIIIIDDPHALKLDTEIATTEGFKTIGTVAVGDYVFAPDGTPTKVVAKSEVWHDREIYKVTTDDNVEIFCDGAHLWNVCIIGTWCNVPAWYLAKHGEFSYSIPSSVHCENRAIRCKRTTERASVQCITVDREDGLFLVGREYVVTHNSEQEAAIAASNPEIYDKVYEWYTSGPRQRLQPQGSVLIIQTRWSKKDLTGQVKQKELDGGGDKWKVVELPAILPNGKPLWPEFWSIEELEATRNAIDVSKWQAQYQQNPTSEEGAIVKRDWWQRWEQDTPPPTSFILQAWDTAFEKHNRADYSACTTWGIFNLPDEKGIDRANIILLDAKRDRLEFPQLKEKVLGEYRYWEPDSLIIEKKASGAPLIYELRHMGIVVSDFTPTRGNDKISRLNAISDIFSSGRVWAPNTRWADEVIDEVAAFPAGQHDDYVDCVSMSLALFRKGGYISTKLDREDEEYEYRRKTSNSYY